jgi:hypothetical protein
MLAGGGAELLGELFFVAARWGLSIGLRAADTAAGQYQGMATTCVALTMMLSSVIMVSLLVTWACQAGTSSQASF